MSFSPIPCYSFKEITDISAKFLTKQGIKFLMLDLDNTIAAYNEHIPAPQVTQWFDEIHKSGIITYIISNSLKKHRVWAFAQELDIGMKMDARKPSPKCVLEAMEQTGFTKEVCAFIGDQIFTDTLAANRAGVTSIIVKPRQFTNPLLAVRYVAESPFRAMCKNISKNSRNTDPIKGKTA